MKAYKLFRIKDGQLYPLYVLANEPTPIGVWLEAKVGTIASDGKHVKSRLGNLAIRAGWHCSDYPVATHIGEKENKTDIKPSYRPKIKYGQKLKSIQIYIMRITNQEKIYLKMVIIGSKQILICMVTGLLHQILR